MSNVITMIQPSSNLQPDYKMALHHLKLIDPAAPGFFFRAIKPGSAPGTWVNKDLSDPKIQQELTDFNNRGYHIYFNPNEIDNSGSNRDKNVTRIRVIFADYDNPEIVPKSYPVRPSFEVETSPGKFHHYWLLKDAITLEDFAGITGHLIDTYGADPQCKNPSRLLRLAGFFHVKRNPIKAILKQATFDASDEFVKYSDLYESHSAGVNPKIKLYPVDELKAAYPPRPREEEKSALCIDYSKLRYNSNQLSSEEPKVLGAVMALSQSSEVLNLYDQWIRCGMALYSAFPNDVGLAYWKKASSGCPNFDESEMESKWPGLGGSDGQGYGYDLSTLYYLAKRAGWAFEEYYINEPDTWPKLDGAKKPISLFSHHQDGWRFAKTVGKNLVYTAGYGWLLFDGSRLIRVPKIQDCPEIIGVLPRAILKESEDERYSEEIKSKLRSHAIALEYNDGLNAACTAAKPHLMVSDDVLDSNDDILGCKNGTLDLVTGELRPAHITDFITKQTNASYLGLDAPEPKLFIEQLNWLFDEDSSVISYVQKWLGYCLTGRVNEHTFPEFIGEGGNGKSKLFESVLYVLGDYGQQISASSFELGAGRVDQAKMAFRGKRLVYAAETKEKGVLNEQFIKDCVGNDKMTGYVNYQDFVTFKCTHKMALITNFQMLVAGKDNSIWRRLVHIHTTARRLDNDDKKRGEKLKAEADLILSWLVRGFHLYLKEGLELPDKLKHDNELFKEEMNLLKRFIADKCVTNLDKAYVKDYVLKSQLVSLYKEWLTKESYDTIRPSRNTVENEMKRMGYTDYQSAYGRVWEGVVLKDKFVLAEISDRISDEQKAKEKSKQKAIDDYLNSLNEEELAAFNESDKITQDACIANYIDRRVKSATHLESSLSKLYACKIE